MSLDEDPKPYRFRFIFAKDEHTLKVSRLSPRRCYELKFSLAFED
jgi:hypothetical protein